MRTLQGITSNRIWRIREDFGFPPDLPFKFLQVCLPNSKWSLIDSDLLLYNVDAHFFSFRDSLSRTAIVFSFQKFLKFRSRFIAFARHTILSTFASKWATNGAKQHPFDPYWKLWSSFIRLSAIIDFKIKFFIFHDIRYYSLDSSVTVTKKHSKLLMLCD